MNNEYCMDNLEISYRLALKIGWNRNMLREVDGVLYARDTWGFKKFDYEDWNVAGPIAERYNCFPMHLSYGWRVPNILTHEDTPQAAIAMAVINS